MLHRFWNRPLSRSLAVLAAVTVAVASAGDAAAQASATGPAAATADATAVKGESGEVRPIDGMPDIGLWMIAKDGQTANWLGVPYKGKKLMEPVNIVIMDGISGSPEEAVARLVAACAKAGFPGREGHSAGYSARIGGAVFPQAPPGTEDCFSDAPFTFGNDHGRIFGPLKWQDAYYFTAAFSREGVDLVTRVKHLFRSFDRARDAFAQALSAKTEYRVTRYLDLRNDFPDDVALTTGDHDGMAVFLEAIR